MSNAPLKDLKYSRFYVRSVYCCWEKYSDLNQNGCEIVRATATPKVHCPLTAVCSNDVLSRFKSRSVLLLAV